MVSACLALRFVWPGGWVRFWARGARGGNLRTRAATLQLDSLRFEMPSRLRCGLELQRKCNLEYRVQKIGLIGEWMKFFVVLRTLLVAQKFSNFSVGLIKR